MSVPIETEISLLKSFTMKPIFSSQRVYKKLQTLHLEQSQSAHELKIPEIFLKNIPPNLCPTIKKTVSVNRFDQSKAMLMMDLGLTPDRPSKTLSMNHLQRTITLSDFLGKKNLRRIVSSHNLGSQAKKLKKRTLILERKSKGSLVNPNIPSKMDRHTQLRMIISKKSKPRTNFTYSQPLAQPANAKNHKHEIDFLNSLLTDCDTLLQENKKTMKDISSSSRNINSQVVALERMAKPLKRHSIIV